MKTFSFSAPRRPDFAIRAKTCLIILCVGGSIVSDTEE
jgi:hypothetical protein